MDEQPYDAEKTLQELLAKHPDLLAGEQIDSEEPRRWLLITREMAVPREEGGTRRWALDHLLLDQDGIPTLVEVKQSSNTQIRREVVGQMLEYAANAMVNWSVETIKKELERNPNTTEESLAEFLEPDTDPADFWQRVEGNLQTGKIRMLFVADAIPAELRLIVEFLNEQMEHAEVLAVEIKQYVGQGMKTLVPRVFGQTGESERKKSSKPQWPNWDEALAEIPNTAIVLYFRQRIEEGQDCSLSQRKLFFWESGKRRWSLNVKLSLGGFSGASQYGRFVGDIEFWRKGLSQPEQVREVSQGNQLNFRLFSKEDFEFFHKAVTGTLQSYTWKVTVG